jgi:hypothetical protein
MTDADNLVIPHSKTHQYAWFIPQHHEYPDVGYGVNIVYLSNIHKVHIQTGYTGPVIRDDAKRTQMTAVSMDVESLDALITTLSYIRSQIKEKS